MSSIIRVVNEQSTILYVATFTDEEGAAITPDTVSYSLTDTKGNVVNSLDGVALSPALEVNIVLSGADLVVSDTFYNNDRVLTVEATYSSTIGTGLPLKMEALFAVSDLVKIE